MRQLQPPLLLALPDWTRRTPKLPRVFEATIWLGSPRERAWARTPPIWERLSSLQPPKLLPYLALNSRGHGLRNPLRSTAKEVADCGSGSPRPLQRWESSVHGKEEEPVLELELPRAPGQWMNVHPNCPNRVEVAEVG